MNFQSFIEASRDFFRRVGQDEGVNQSPTNVTPPPTATVPPPPGESVYRPPIVQERSPEDSIVTFHSNANEIIKLCVNGKIYIRGELVSDNKEVYNALVAWLTYTGTYNSTLTKKQQKILDQINNNPKTKTEMKLNKYKFISKKIV